jgi:hypothetical protein
MDGIGRAIDQGRVSFAFLEATPFRRWAQRANRSYREVCREAGVPFGSLRSVLEAFGYARMGPDDRIREDELEVPLVRQAVLTGLLDEAWMTRVGRAHAQGLWKAAMAENERTTRDSRWPRSGPGWINPRPSSKPRAWPSLGTTWLIGR